MLNHIGTQNIETDRLLLRKFEITDAPKMFNNLAKNPDNVKYLSWQAHKNIDETYKVLNKWLEEYKNQNYYRWCIALKNTNEAIGSIDVIEIIEIRSTCEIGYVVSKKFWNNGIMTEALGAVIKFLFTNVNFNRIQLRHATENPASGKVMLKCGLKFEGILRQYGFKNNGERCDSAIYSILREEFNNYTLGGFS